MKKIKFASMLLAGILCMGTMVGCGFTPINAPTEDEVKNAQKYDGEIALIISQKDDEYLSHLDQAVKAAADVKGCDLYSVDCNNDIDREIKLVQDAVKKQAGAIIIEVIDDARVQDIIDAAGDTPVVFINRTPKDTSILDETHVFVGSNEDESGKLQGEALADCLKKQKKTDVNYLMFKGTEGMVHTKMRSENALKALTEAGIHAQAAAEPVYCDFSRDKAKAEMDAMLADGLDMSTVDCIISNNDSMALGVIESLEKNKIDFSNIDIVGIDGTNAGMRAIRDGAMAATVYQNAAAQASTSVQLAINLALGSDLMIGVEHEQDKDNEFMIWVPFETVTIDNVDDFH